MLGAVGGVADFTGQGLNIQLAGTGYILTASTTGLPIADSAAFNITAAPASQLVVAASPLNTQAGRTLTMTVEARDAFGNLDTAFAGAVDAALRFAGRGDLAIRLLGNLEVDTGKARDLLGFVPPVSFEAGIAEMAAAWRSSGE